MDKYEVSNKIKECWNVVVLLLACVVGVVILIECAIFIVYCGPILLGVVLIAAFKLWIFS